MDGQDAGQTEEQRKADIIAKQIAEADRMMSSEAPANKDIAAAYESGKISIMGFVIAVIVGIFGTFGIVMLLALIGSSGIAGAFALVYSIAMVVLAFVLYRGLSRSNRPSSIRIAAFVFVLVAALEAWISFGGIITAVVAYLIISHNGWIE